MDDITCPYCEHGFEYQGDGVGDGDYFEEECPECEKSFMVNAQYSVDYYSEKAPCLNGGEHKWEHMCGAPKEFFVGKYRCKWCNKEKKFTPEEEAKLNTQNQKQTNEVSKHEM